MERPSRFHASAEGMQANAILGRDFACRSTIRQNPRILTVEPLLHACRPPAVARPIVAVVVHTINRQALPVSVSESPRTKGREALPLFANRNAASAISIVLVGIRILASLLHAIPKLVELRSATAMRRLKLHLLETNSAAAGPRDPAQKRVNLDRLFVTARTPAKPHHALRLIKAERLDGGHSSKRHPRNISVVFRHLFHAGIITQPTIYTKLETPTKEPVR